MNIRRILSCLLLPAYLSSCTNWHVQSASPAQVVLEEHPSQVRVTTISRSEVVLTAPRVSGDTLIGLAPRNSSWVGSQYAVSDTGSALAIPLANITQVALKKPDNAPVGIVAGIGVVAFLFIISSISLWE